MVVVGGLWCWCSSSEWWCGAVMPLVLPWCCPGAALVLPLVPPLPVPLLPLCVQSRVSWGASRGLHVAAQAGQHRGSNNAPGLFSP